MMRGTGVRGLRGIIAFGAVRRRLARRGRCSISRATSCAREAAASAALVARGSGERRACATTATTCGCNVLPALRARWPAAAHHAERLAEQMGDAERLLEAVAARGRDGRSRRRGTCRAQRSRRSSRRGSAICCAICCAARARARRARAKLEELRNALLESHAESRTRVRWPGGEGRVFREALHLVAPLPPAVAARATRRASAPAAPWVGPRGPRRRSRRARDGAGLPQSWLEDGSTLRFRARRRAIPAARARPSSLAEALVPGKRHRAVDARARAAAVSRRRARRDRRPVGQRRRRTPRPRASRVGACSGPSIRPCVAPEPR